MKIEKTVKKTVTQEKIQAIGREALRRMTLQKTFKELRVIKLIRAYGECLATNS